MISQTEFDAILDDRTKRTVGDLAWSDDPQHSPARTFRTPVLSDREHALDIVGRWNPKTGKLSYVILHRGTGRIYALDMGAGHRNPDQREVGETHKHRWTADLRDKQAYVPQDITASWAEPVEVWEQFCVEAGIEHDGILHNPEWQDGWVL